MVVVHLSVWLACKTVYVSWYLQPNPLLVKITHALLYKMCTWVHNTRWVQTTTDTAAAHIHSHATCALHSLACRRTFRFPAQSSAAPLTLVVVVGRRCLAKLDCVPGCCYEMCAKHDTVQNTPAGRNNNVRVALPELSVCP